jgi:hypothetical protein
MATHGYALINDPATAPNYLYVYVHYDGMDLEENINHSLQEIVDKGYIHDLGYSRALIVNNILKEFADADFRGGVGISMLTEEAANELVRGMYSSGGEKSEYMWFVLNMGMEWVCVNVKETLPHVAKQAQEELGGSFYRTNEWPEEWREWWAHQVQEEEYITEGERE